MLISVEHKKVLSCFLKPLPILHCWGLLWTSEKFCSIIMNDFHAFHIEKNLYLPKNIETFLKTRQFGLIRGSSNK